MAKDKQTAWVWDWQSVIGNKQSDIRYLEGIGAGGTRLQCTIAIVYF